VTRPCTAACERNREPIAARLGERLPANGDVLEIGSGTGQHAVYFGARFPGMFWQPSDVAENHPGIRGWIEFAGLKNVRAPFELDVLSSKWPAGVFDAAYTANTAHIMPIDAVERMFEGVARALASHGFFFLYGPVNRNGEFTSDSNRAFDAYLRARDPRMGLRDDRVLAGLAQAVRLQLVADYALPANNRGLVLRRPEASRE
jgi:SAM-dependent methyltransferase